MKGDSELAYLRGKVLALETALKLAVEYIPEDSISSREIKKGLMRFYSDLAAQKNDFRFPDDWLSGIGAASQNVHRILDKR